MNCEQSNQLDMVDYLFSLGYQPQKIRNEDHWYLSPLRDEKEPSFKINKQKNLWYDHGLGKGGKLVDFAKQFFNCGVTEALQKISSFHQQINSQNPASVQPVQRDQNVLFNEDNASKTAIKIIDAKQPITSLILCRYLNKRRIAQDIANKYCNEIYFRLNDKIHTAIGFKNAAGGYELRNEYFKVSCSPKYVTYLDNKADKITVFESFFDFLSYETILQNQQQWQSNFLVLNSLSFFERSLLLMEKHERIHLYLDQDEAGRKCTAIGLKRSLKFHDESKLYKGYKDLSEWVMNIGKANKQRQFLGRHL